MSTSKQLILKVFNKYSLLLTLPGRKWLEAMVEGFPDNDPEDMLEHMASGLLEESGPVGTEALNRVYEKLQVSGADGNGVEGEDDGEDLPEDHLTVISAFDMPRLVYNQERRAFEKPTEPPSILGKADSKAGYMRDRYNIIKQVILRSDHFSPPALPGHDRKEYLQLTGIKNLLGRPDQRFLLFGLLSRTIEGAYCLEDLDDRVVLDLSDAIPAVGLFSEGCFVLVDGIYRSDQIFQVNDIAHPPSEGRTLTRSLFGHIDHLGNGALSLAQEEIYTRLEQKHATSFLFLSDLHLDQPRVLSGLTTILKGYEEAQIAPAAFVFTGNFSSTPFLLDGRSTSTYQKNFKALADILGQFPLISTESHFIFVPGPTDPWDGTTLPRAPLPASISKIITARIPKAVFTTSPCRIQYLGQEIVVMREDMMSKMLRNTICIKSEEDRKDEEERRKEQTEASRREERIQGVAEEDLTLPLRSTVLQEYLVQTILDQAHLCPLPLQVKPVVWEFDHSLRLYPMPTVLVLADKTAPYEMTYELGDNGSDGQCRAFNPGSFAGNRGWTTYLTDTRSTQPSELPI